MANSNSILILFDEQSPQTESDEANSLPIIKFTFLCEKEKRSIIINVIDYLFFTIIDKCRGEETFEVYLEHNPIDITRIYKLPYFVATSNGHSESLFHLFETFKVVSNYISSETYNLIIESKMLKYFETDFASFGFIKPIKLKAGFKKVSNELKELILDEMIEIQSTKYKFRDIKILKDNQEQNLLFKALDTGVEALNKRTLNSFFKMGYSDYIYYFALVPGFLEKMHSIKQDDKVMHYNKESIKNSRLYFEYN